MLARAGARVLLLDRARFPRDKLCGDTVNPGTLATLRRLGLAWRVEPRALPVRGHAAHGRSAAQSCVATTGRGFMVWPFSGATSTRPCSRNPCWRARVSRKACSFGRRCVESAVGRPRVRGVVIAGRDGRDIRIPAPLVIAADGRRSRIALALRLARHPKWPRRWAVGGYFDGVQEVDDLGRCTSVRTGTSGSRRCRRARQRLRGDADAQGLRPAGCAARAGRRGGLVSRRPLRVRAPGDTAGRPRASRRRRGQRCVSRGCCSRATPPASSTRSPVMACASRFAAPSLPRVSPSARWSGGPAIPR